MKNKEVQNEFKNLMKQEKLDIFSIEDLMINKVQKYKDELTKDVEEGLRNLVDEGEIIVKKNKSGKIVDIISTTKEKKN